MPTYKEIQEHKLDGNLMNKELEQLYDNSINSTIWDDIISYNQGLLDAINILKSQENKYDEILNAKSKLINDLEFDKQISSVKGVLDFCISPIKKKSMEGLITAIEGFMMTNPYFLAVSSDYAKSDKSRIMIVAKETYGWGHEISIEEREKTYSQNEFPSDIFVKPDVHNLMSLYDINQNSDDVTYGPWSFRQDILNSLKNDTSVIVNNLHFIGYCQDVNEYRAGTNPDIEIKFNDIKGKGSILKQEIEICKPDIVLFCVGKKLDGGPSLNGKNNGTTIVDKLGDFRVQKMFDDYFFDELILNDKDFVAKISEGKKHEVKFYRTYHPRCLSSQFRNLIIEKIITKKL